MKQKGSHNLGSWQRPPSKMLAHGSGPKLKSNRYDYALMGTPRMSACSWTNRSLLVRPPSTRSDVIASAGSWLVRRTTSFVWKQIPSSVARARWARASNRVSRQISLLASNQAINHNQPRPQLASKCNRGAVYYWKVVMQDSLGSAFSTGIISEQSYRW